MHVVGSKQRHAMSCCKLCGIVDAFIRMIVHTAQVEGVTWHTLPLFQPATWSGASHAPFLDMLAEYLTKIAEHPYASDQINHSQNQQTPSWARAHQGTTPAHVCAKPGAAHCDQFREASSCKAKPYALEDHVSTLSPENVQIRASALVPPGPSASGPPSDTMTSAGFAAQSDSNSGATFLGQQTSTLPLSAYVHRLARYTGCSAVCFLYALSYILRICHQGNIDLTEGTVHRLLLTAVVVAIKFIEDECCMNMHYAKVGGVALSDLNRMELTMCSLLDFRFNLADGDASIILKRARSFRHLPWFQVSLASQLMSKANSNSQTIITRRGDFVDVSFVHLEELLLS